MQVEETLSEGLKRAFKLTVPAGDLETEIEERLVELSKTVTMKGFRPGKVPIAIVRRRFRPNVLGEVLRKTVETRARETIEERELRPAQQPEIEIADYDDGKDLEFTVVFEILPEIALGDFSEIAVDRLRAEVSDESVDEALQRIAEAEKRFEPVEEPRPAAMGDQLVVDIAVEVDGEPVADGGQTDMAFDMEEDDPIFPGLSEKLVGVKAGENREVEVPFPEDYPAAAFGGKTALFKVSMKELRGRVPPAVDDAMAERHGANDLADMRERVRGSIREQYDRFSQARLKRAILDALDERYRFDVPAGMVEREFGGIWGRVEADATRVKKTVAELLEQPEEEAKTEYREIAERRIRLGLLLAEIGRANDISVEQEELGKAALEMAQASANPRAMMDYYQQNPSLLEQFRPSIFEDKVVAFLAEVAAVSEREVAPDELMRDPDEDDEKAAPAASDEGGAVAETETESAEKADA